MSKVEMDLSEYNQMLENKRLLEDVNKKLETAYKDNKELQQEKVDVLKANEHNVTIVSKKRLFQSVYTDRPEYEIRRRLEELFGGKMEYGVIMGGPNAYSKAFLGCLYKFEDHTSEIEGEEKVYSVKLDQMKKEIRDKEKEKLDKEVKSKLAENGKLSLKVTELLGQIKELENQKKVDFDIHENILEAHRKTYQDLTTEKEEQSKEFKNKEKLFKSEMKYIEDKSYNVSRIFRKDALSSIHEKASKYLKQ